MRVTIQTGFNVFGPQVDDDELSDTDGDELSGVPTTGDSPAVASEWARRAIPRRSEKASGMASGGWLGDEETQEILSQLFDELAREFGMSRIGQRGLPSFSINPDRYSGFAHRFMHSRSLAFRRKSD